MSCASYLPGPHLDSEIGHQQLRRDTRRFENYRQSAAGMSSPAGQVNAFQILEPVMWTEVQHLVEAVRQVECRAEVDVVVMLPVVGRDHALKPDSRLDIGHADLAQLTQRNFSVSC